MNENILKLNVIQYYDSKGLEIDFDGDDIDGSLGLISVEQMQLTESLIAIMIGEELSRNAVGVCGSISDTLNTLKCKLKSELLNQYNHNFTI